MTAPSGLAQRLAALDSCACSDALDKLGLFGVALGLRPQTGPWRIAGPVITVQLEPVSVTGASPDLLARGTTPGTPGLLARGTTPATPGRHLGTAAVEAAQPGDVIVVATGGRTDAAGWGGILALAAVTRQVAGVIVDGACRDVDESRELGLPVYAVAAVPATARGRQAEVAWNVPVQVAGVSVHPGDLVIADGSGVVFLPAGRAAAVIDAAEEIAAREAAMAARVRAGEPVSRVMSGDYEHMLSIGKDNP